MPCGPFCCESPPADSACGALGKASSLACAVAGCCACDPSCGAMATDRVPTTPIGQLRLPGRGTHPGGASSPPYISGYQALGVPLHASDAEAVLMLYEALRMLPTMVQGGARRAPADPARPGGLLHRTAHHRGVALAGPRPHLTAASPAPGRRSRSRSRAALPPLVVGEVDL
jgi:hypothetical protein